MILVKSSFKLRWSVIMVKRWPRRYCRHFLTAEVMEKSSRTYVEARRSFGVKALIKKAMGCPYCDKTAPIPTLNAFVSTVNGRLNSGKASTGAVDKACLRLSKAN